jgi:hypothetical protein
MAEYGYAVGINRDIEDPTAQVRWWVIVDEETKNVKDWLTFACISFSLYFPLYEQNPIYDKNLLVKMIAHLDKQRSCMGLGLILYVHKVINKHRTSSMIEEPMDMRYESENYSNWSSEMQKDRRKSGEINKGMIY